MITKGIIKTIDYSNNSCKVRIPLFETANTSDEVNLPAIFLTQPGVYNGYNEGDIVFVGFEGSGLDCPIVLGKLFLGASKESENSKKGSIEASNLVVDSTATLPLTTKLTFKDTSKTQVQVANRYSNYKSLLDIIDAINNTEENITVANKNFMNSTNSVVSKVVTEYLSQAETLDTPTKENPGWSTSMPNLTDGFDIWQKTTCYNHRGEILGEPEILCLTGVVASFIYTIATSSKVHTGTAQTEKIVVEAKVKIGTQSETADNNALIRYSWSDGVWIDAQEPKNKVEITECRDKDLIIKAYHQIDTDLNGNPVYDEYTTETITFIAQNTPTLDLSRDSASIAYDSFGEDKINSNDEVSTTATLYFNGQVVEDAEYTWDYNANLCTATINNNTNTITVSDLVDSIETVELTCNTTYNGVSLSKVFTVTKVLQGKSPYKIDIVNEFVSIITESDGVIPTDYPWTTNTLHTVNIYYGDKLVEVTEEEEAAEEKGIKVGTETPTGGSDLYLKYTITTGLTAGTPTQVSNTTASFTNKASALGNDVDRGEIKYELYEGPVLVASEKFELVRIKCGEAAMHYTGKTSTNTIKRDPAGNLTPETVTIWLDKTVGHDTNTVNTTDYKLYYSKTKEDSLTLLEASESKGISINNNKWTIDTNKLGIQGQLSLDFRVALGDSSDFTTISMIDIPVVNDGESVDVEYAYWWSDNYYNADNKMWDLEAPTSVSAQETAAAESWFKPSDAPSIEDTYYENNNCKIIFVSRRMGIASDINSALWSKPEMFAVANSEAYKILSTAEGLFGYGQGLYYTFQVPESPTTSQQALFTTTADGKKQITINKIPSSAGSYNCVEGVKITATQEEIAHWISEDPAVRKELIKVYIDAEYIKTGAFTVGNASNPLFQAGLDTGVDNKPLVKIGGFNVEGNKLTSGAGTSTIVLQSKSDDTEFKSIYLGNDNPENAPFSVTNTGKLKATSGQIGGFKIEDQSLNASSYSGNILISPEGITLESSADINSADIQINPEFLATPTNFIKYSIIPDNIIWSYSQGELNTPLNNLQDRVQFIIDNPELLEAETDELDRLCIFVNSDAAERWTCFGTYTFENKTYLQWVRTYDELDSIDATNVTHYSFLTTTNAIINNNRSTGYFNVTSDGIMTATAGTIGGFDITTTSLSATSGGYNVTVSPTEIRLGSEDVAPFEKLTNKEIIVKYVIYTDTNEKYKDPLENEYVIVEHGYDDNGEAYFITAADSNPNTELSDYFKYAGEINFNNEIYSKWIKYDLIEADNADGVYSVLTNRININDSGLFKVLANGELFSNKGTIGGFEISENKLKSIVEQNNYFSISDTYEVTNVQLTNTADITYSNFNLINFPIYITKNDENKTEVLVTGSDEDEDNDSYYVYCSKPSADNASISTFIALERPDFDNDFTIVDSSGNTSTNTGNTLTPPPSGGNTGTNTNKASYCIAKIKFKADISYFRFYIASSAESNYDYMIASTLNAATIPTSDTSSASAYKSTRGKQTAATNGNVDKIDLTADTTIKVEYESIKEGNYVYVVFRKDHSVNTLPDCGWLIMPKEFNADVVEVLGQDVSFNSANVHRDRQIWLTPQGSSETIAGEPGSDWGLTVGKDFGVDLRGQLFAKGAVLKGTISAEKGTIGPLTVNDVGVSAGGLSIATDRLTLTKSLASGDATITLGIANEEPYIDFNKVGSIYGPDNKCGFKFTSTSTTKSRSFKAEVSRSNKNVTVNIYVKVNEKWESLSAIQAERDLINTIVLQTETKGVDKDFWGNGTNITETLTFTFAPGGSSSQTKALSKDFDVFGSTTFVKNDKSSYEFEQTKYTADALTSIGGILPGSKTCVLGNKDNPWSEIWASNATSNAFFAQGDGIVQLSDSREKTHINYDLSKYNSFFDSLKPTSYRFVNSTSKRTHLGFIAQEVEQSLYQNNMSRKDGALVVINGDGFDKKTDSIVDEDKVKYGIRYSELHALEIDQIQKLKKRVSDQEQIIKDLETRIKNLETK